MTFRARLRSWWLGHGTGARHRMHETEDADGNLRRGLILQPINARRHWTSRLAHAVVGFYLRHWQWLWGSVVAAAGVVAALLAIPK